MRGAFITGATGFIGSHLLEEVNPARGWRVKALARPRSETRLLARLGPAASDALLRGLDRIARRLPSLADVIVVAGRPRR